MPSEDYLRSRGPETHKNCRLYALLQSYPDWTCVLDQNFIKLICGLSIMVMTLPSRFLWTGHKDGPNYRSIAKNVASKQPRMPKSQQCCCILWHQKKCTDEISTQQIFQATNLDKLNIFVNEWHWAITDDLHKSLTTWIISFLSLFIDGHEAC